MRMAESLYVILFAIPERKAEYNTRNLDRWCPVLHTQQEARTKADLTDYLCCGRKISAGGKLT